MFQSDTGKSIPIIGIEHSKARRRSNPIAAELEWINSTTEIFHLAKLDAKSLIKPTHYFPDMDGN